MKIQIIIKFKNKGIQKSFRIKVKMNVQYSFFSVEHCFLKVKINSMLLLDTVTTNRTLSLNHLYIKCYLTHNLVYDMLIPKEKIWRRHQLKERDRVLLIHTCHRLFFDAIFFWHTHAPVGPLHGVVLTRLRQA